MDLAIIAGIGLIGSYIINNNDTPDPITDSENKYSNYNNVDQIEKNENNNSLTYDNSYMDINTVKLFPTNYNSKVRHIYDTKSVPQLNKKYYEMAGIQAEKSKNPVVTNILSPYFQPYENVTNNELIMGSVPITELSNDNNQSFDNQFNLQTVDNSKEPFSIGETSLINKNLNDFTPFESASINMTYNIVDKEHFIQNNMQPMNAKRDIETNESNNFEYKMDVFSGSSKNWFPKREAPHFFEPQENIQNPLGTGLVTNLERDRIVQSRIKQNQRPFEPIKTAPGLNLDYNQQPVTGFHDTFRAMPISTDQLRPANKPKISFEDRIKGGPKKGEKRGVAASVIKRRPNHWRYQTTDDLVPSKALTTKQSNQGEFIIPDNGRMRTCELVGPSQGRAQIGASNREGDVKISKRVKHVEDRLGPKTTEKFNPNDKSYKLFINERNTTNYNIMQPTKNTNKNGVAFNPDDIAKQTIKQITTLSELNTQMNSAQKNSAMQYSDKANTTMKEILTILQTNTMIGGNQHNPISNFSDISKNTLREILTAIELNTNIGSAQHKPHASLTDEAKTTFKQILTSIQLNTNMNSNKKESISEIMDIAKNTVKQLLTNKELNTNISSNKKEAFTNFQDDAKSTIKQSLTNKELNTNMSSNKKEAFTNFQDDAKTTNKQTLTDSVFNTFITNTMQSYSNLNDDAKQTIKQILAVQPLETIIGTTQHNSYTNIQDDVKQTLKQLLTLQLFNNNVRQNIGSYSNISDDIKFTLKEILSTIENNNNIKSANHSTYTELADIAKNTIKEFISTIPLNNNMGTIKKEVAFDPDDLARTTHKQDLLNEKYMGVINNSNIGSTQVNFDIQPTMKDITKIIDYKSAATAAGINNQPMSQQDARAMRQNIAKEKISQGQYPTLSGPKMIPVKEQYDNMNLNNKPNFTRANAPKLSTKIDLNDRIIFDRENQRFFPSYDERLYNELLTQFNDNPLINNPQSTANAKFKI